MFTYILFAIGLVFLIKGANFLVDGAASVARSLNVSDLVIGLTVVAFGTSTPELFVNIIASFKGNTDIAIGNVLGSNIANIFLILGVSSVIYPLSVTKGTVWKEIPFSLLAAIILLFRANDQILDDADASALTRIDGLIFFVLGISATIRPLPFQTKNNVDIAAVIVSSLMLFFFMFTGKKRSLDRWEGMVCLMLYLGYVIFLIGND